MSVIYSKIPVPGGWADSSYFTTISNRFTLSGRTYDNIPTILLDNKVEFAIHISYTHVWYVDANGSWQRVEWGWTGDCYLEVAVAEDVVYIRITNNPDGRGLVFCIIKHNDHYYIGGRVLQSQPGATAYDINTISFTDLDTKLTQNYIINALPFPSTPGHLAYLSNAFVSNNGSTCFNLKDTLSCTSVAFGSTISIDSDNYYAIGTNTLLRIDEVV